MATGTDGPGDGPERTQKGPLNLLDLNHDILHLIVITLQSEHPRLLFPLATVSKAFYNFVLPQLYYSVELQESVFRDRDPTINPLLMRLEDENDNMRNMIHELTISDDTFSAHDGEPVDVNILLKLLGTIVSLHSFRWDTCKAIHPSVVELFESRWPNVKVLIVKEFVRCYPDKYVTGSPLLSSPVVHSLFLPLGREDYEREGQVRELSRLITQATKVQKLGLDMFPYSSQIYPRRQLLPRDWNLGKPGQLINLVSLNLLQRAEVPQVLMLTRTILAEAPKWTHIRELQLCGLEANYTIRNLKYRVPNLRHLQLVYGNKDPEYRDSFITDESMDELYLVQSFVSHLRELQELRVTNVVSEIEAITLAILELTELEALSFHTPKFHELFARTTPSRVPLFKMVHLRQLSKSKIKYLELDTGIADFSQHCNPLSIQNLLENNSPFESLIQVLTEFTRLQTLRLYIIISGASDFTEEFPGKSPRLLEDKTKSAVEALFRKLYDGGKGNELLREVEVWFTLIQETHGPTEMHRSLRTGDNGPVKATRVYEPYEVGKEVKLKVEICDRWINGRGVLTGLEPDWNDRTDTYPGLLF